MMVDGLTLILFGALVAACIIEWRTRRVPNGLTLPGLVVVGGWRLTQGRADFLWLWAGIFTVWAFGWVARRKWIGGADAKVLMVLTAFWPSQTFAVVLGMGLAVVSLTWAIIRERRQFVSWVSRLPAVAAGLIPVKADQPFVLPVTLVCAFYFLGAKLWGWPGA